MRSVYLHLYVRAYEGGGIFRNLAYICIHMHTYAEAIVCQHECHGTILLTNNSYLIAFY